MPYAMASIFTTGSSADPLLYSGVWVSRKRGSRMSTLAPRRVRMFRERVPKRGWGLITLSGMHSELATGPRGASHGSAKRPTPSSGKFTMYGAISSSDRAARSRRRRRRMLRSTAKRSVTFLPYGFLGVDSSIHAPYSWCHTTPSRRCSCSPSSACKRSMISEPTRWTLTLLEDSSTLRMAVSTSSPHLSSSFSMCRTARQVFRNCRTPCRRMYFMCGLPSSHLSGLPTLSRPMLPFGSGG
mmetsp:Transcript_1414/g.6173  ORF Transcript_1414/g.6173 Transcript_1414/m.6173 type:complete len:241 (-) Transcript_1414:245-967(-)